MLLPSRRQWSEWSLPSKLTAIGTLVTVLSLCLYLVEKSLPFFDRRSTSSALSAVPAVSLELQNTTAEPINIQRRGDFVLWLPQGVDNLRRLPGRYELEQPDGQDGKPTLAISVGAESRVLAKLHSEVQLVPLLNGGAADLEFIFRKEQGEIIFSGSIPFERQRITTTLWKIDLGKKE